MNPRLLPILLLLPLVAACTRETVQTPAPPLAEVSVVTLVPQRVELKRELPGRVTPYLVAEVRPQVGGIVARRLFEEGGNVEAGAPLYQLDDEVYRANVASARAHRERARAALALARVDEARTRQLAEAEAVSRQESERAVAVLRQAEAELQAAEAAVSSAEVTLGYGRITAPIAGRIGRSSVTQGALVTANQPQALATIQQLDPIYVDLTQSSRELLALRQDVAAGRAASGRGLPVTLLLEDGSRYAHPGQVAFSEVTVNPATGTFGLRVTVPNPEHLLLPGMYLRAVVATGVRENGLLAPQRAIQRDARGGTFAMVVDAEGRVEMRPVEVSRTVGDQWLVEAGLEAGERVVVAGLQKIRSGDLVRVAAETGAVN
jgi:membrane fusion protein (multidrug efflux system)